MDIHHNLFTTIPAPKNPQQSQRYMPERWVAIQRNPVSGSGRGRSELKVLASELKKCGFRVRMFANRERMDEWARQKQQAGILHCVVAAGGDGTVANVMNRYPNVPIAMLPLGTENLLAQYFHLKRDGKRLAHIIADDQRRIIDLGQAGDAFFSLMASAGVDADVIHRLHSTRTGTISHWNYVQTIWQSVRKYAYPEIRVFPDDATEPICGRLVVIVNIPKYAFGIQIANAADPYDGQFEVRVFRDGGMWKSAQYLVAARLGKHERRDDVDCFQASKIRLECDTDFPMQMDGEVIAKNPSQIEIVPQTCTVIVPS